MATIYEKTQKKANIQDPYEVIIKKKVLKTTSAKNSAAKLEMVMSHK